MRRYAALLVPLLLPVGGHAQSRDRVDFAMAMASGITAIHALWHPRGTYAGRDELGVPHYIRRSFTADERRLLRTHFGIEEPSRLYLSDSTNAAYLVYDTELDPGHDRLVRSYRVGAASVRLPGESWEELERRLGRRRPSSFGRAVRRPVTSLEALAPGVRDHFARMLADARAAGHRVRVAESWRSPERQAYLMVLDGGLTFTATSLHTSGHAVDLVVGDGNLRSRRTRARWVAFRQWLAAYDSGRFRMIGTPERSWDWPHVELADSTLGYHSIEDVLAAARAADSTCCDPLAALIHSSHDPARSGAVALPGVGSGDVEVRLHGPPGRSTLPAR